MGRFTYQAILEQEDEGGYSVEIPDLPGCYSQGSDFADAIDMAADAGKTYIAALMLDGDPVPEATKRDIPEGCECAWVSFEADEGYIVRGEVVSAAQAARELGISAGRVTHMLDSGVLDGYRRGRRTYVSMESIERRKAAGARPGRPKKAAAMA